MAFKKGESGNKSGRPKGTKNKVTDKLRASITAFLSKNFDELTSGFDEMPLKEKAKLYCDLLQYILPKMQATSIDFGFEKLPESDLDEILNQLIKKQNEKLQPSQN